MTVDLSEVLLEGHRTIEREVLVEMRVFSCRAGEYPVLSREPLSLRAEYLKEGRLLITGKGGLTLAVPCDRCLKTVKIKVVLDFSKRVNLEAKDGGQEEEFDEASYIDGRFLDVDKLVYNETLTGLPAKILCREDCRGICAVCGQDLNEKACACKEEGFDFRMSAIRDVFKNFKEV